MKAWATVVLLFAAAHAGKVSPIPQALKMITDLQAKVIKEGGEAQTAYEGYAEFCEDRSRQLGFEIKIGRSWVQESKAIISSETANMASLSTRIEEKTGHVTKAQQELKMAEKIRAEARADFEAEENALLGIVDTLGRAIGILEKQMSQGGSSMLQVRNARNIEQALAVMVDASMITVEDGSKLTALVQSSQAEDESVGDELEDDGAPNPAVYKSQGAPIVDVMQGLYEKAEEQLASLRQAEEANMHSHKMLKQSLDAKASYGNQEIAAAKQGTADSGQKKADAEGELAVVSKDLAQDIASLEELHQDCMAKATDFEDETNSRAEELKALASAKKILGDISLEQEDNSDDADSFLQVKRSKSDSRSFQVMQIVRGLAKAQHSSSLAQLASRLSSVMSLGRRSGEDVFAKVKGLIADMIESLEAQAEADASTKAYCDKENAESAEKKSAKEASLEKLTTAVDYMSASIDKLGEEIGILQKELSQIATAQAKMEDARRVEKALFESSKAWLDKAIKSTKFALKVLTEYYGKGSGDHGAAEGAGSSIISMLEVAESDFTKDLAEKVSTEENDIAEFKKESDANELATTVKNQDVKYKTKEVKALSKSLAEAKEDLSAVKDEYGAVLEYIEKLKGKCFPLPPEPYEDRVKRREAEIDGLKKALLILDGEALIQTSSKHFLQRMKVPLA